MSQTSAPPLPRTGPGLSVLARARPRLAASRWAQAGLAVRVLIPLVALAVAGWPTFLGTLLAQEGGLWLTRRLTSDRAFGAGLFLGAWTIRAVVAIGLHVALRDGNGNGAFLQDDYSNDLVAWWLLRIGHGEGLAVFPAHKHVLDSSYTYLVAALYAVFGYAPLLPKLINAALGGLTAGLVLEIGRRSFGPAVGRLAGLGMMLLPTTVLWSAVTLKEMLLLGVLTLALATVLWLASEPARSNAWLNAGTVLVATLVALADLRLAAAAIVGVLAIGVLTARALPRVRPRAIAAAVAGTAVLLLAVILVLEVSAPAVAQGVQARVDSAALALRQRRGWEALNARSQFTSREDIAALDIPPEMVPAGEASTGFNLQTDVLQPLAFALFAPAPWQAETRLQFGVSLEMLGWYVLTAASLLAWRARPRQPLFVGALVLYALAVWVLLALSEGNLGNLTRHRVMLAPALLLLGAAGLSTLGRFLPVPLRRRFAALSA